MWFVVASNNGGPGIEVASDILRGGGSALDAVEEAARRIGSNALDDSVGVGGLPNVLGQVELDASIMDGSTLASGAVGALQGYEHPISVARMVMEKTPHVFLVGAGAAHFAQEMGLPPAELLTEQSRARWQAVLSPLGPPSDAESLEDRPGLVGLVTRLGRAPQGHGTVNFLARDEAGLSKCLIYPVRPTQCRTWPFWPANLQSVESWCLAALRCPGINRGTLHEFDEIRRKRDQTRS